MSHVIIGGGIAGLSTAFYLSKQTGVSRIVVLESSKRLGGWIDTTRNGDGTIYEHGPRTIRPKGPQGANTLELVETLGLTDRVRAVKAGHPSTINRMVCVDGALHKLPSSYNSLFKRLPPFKKALVLAGLQELRAPVKRGEDTPIFEFISRRFGEDIAQYAVDPLVRGICAGNARELSVHFIASYLHEKEQADGSFIKGYLKDSAKAWFSPTPETVAQKSDLARLAKSEKWAVWGLEGGLETLTEALAQHLKEKGVEIFTEAQVQNITFKGGTCIVNSGSSLTCDKLTLALPSFAAATLTNDISPELSDALAEIPYVDVAVVNLEFKGDILKEEGFGFLVPSNQPQPILGCIFDTCTFKQGRRTILTVMMGGAWFNSLLKGKSELEIETLALETVSKVLNFKEQPVRSKTMILKQCIAQYTVGHTRRVRTARDIIREKGLPLSIVGSSYDGVGINDTIMSARNSVESTA